MKRAIRSGLVLLGAVLLGGAVTACEIIDFPDGYLDDGGDVRDGDHGDDGSPDPGADARADTGGVGGEGGTRLDGGGDATMMNPGDASPSSDGGSSDGGSEAGSVADCAAAAMPLYAVNGSGEIFTADLADKTFTQPASEPTLCDAYTAGASSLAVTRAGEGMLMTGKGSMYEVDLSSGHCGKVGAVTGGTDYEEMAITYARPAGVDVLYTCSPAGLGMIDSSFVWSKIGTAGPLPQSRGCRIKPGPDGYLAVFVSDDSGGAPEYALYLLDASTGQIGQSSPLPLAADVGDAFDFAWSASTFYLYAGPADGDNDVQVYTYVPPGTETTPAFKFGGETFYVAAQSTCVP